MGIQETFIEIYQQNIHREGADRFLEYLTGTLQISFLPRQYSLSRLLCGRIG